MTETEEQPAGNIDNAWFLQPADKLVTELKRRREDFLGFFDSSGLMTRIKTSYCYYHSNFYEGTGIQDARIQCGGEEGEWDLMSINHFRSVLSLLKTYICTQTEIAWDTVAKKSTYATNEMTKASNEYLDCVASSPELGLQPVLKQAVEDALVTSMGYGWVLYDESMGQELDADEAGTIYHEGDLKFLTPSWLDVTYDLDSSDFRRSPWVLVRRKENKYDLVAQHPELKSQILKGSMPALDKYEEIFAFNAPTGEKKVSSDNTWVYYLYIRPSPAIPDGRFVRFVNEKAVLKDEKLPGGCTPVHQLLPSRYMHTALGYTVAWDLICPQEALHMAANTILTNQNRFGGGHVQFPAGTPVRVGELEGVGTVFQTDGDIKSVELLKNPGELFKSVDMWVATLERLSGVNATARGNPEPSLHAARAISFVEERAQQSASDLVANYRQFLGEMGTTIINTLAQYAKSPKEYTVHSTSGSKITKSLTPEMLKSLKSVSVVPGNPALSTVEGRTRLAETMMQQGALKDPAQVISVMKTGDLQPLTESVDQKQLSLVQAENEALLRGEQIPAPADYDDHVTHIPGHFAAISTPEARRDPTKAPYVLAHLAQHFEKLEDPLIAARLAVLYPKHAMPPLPGPNNPMTAGPPVGPEAVPPPAPPVPPPPPKSPAGPPAPKGPPMPPTPAKGAA